MLRDTFFEELVETINQIEEAFLRLERNPNDKNVIQEIFRYFHNIKGSSKTVGLADLSQFAHGVENTLSNIRNDSITITDEIIDSLLRCSDLMKNFSENYNAGNFDPISMQNEITFLKKLGENQTLNPDVPEATNADSPSQTTLEQDQSDPLIPSSKTDLFHNTNNEESWTDFSEVPAIEQQSNSTTADPINSSAKSNSNQRKIQDNIKIPTSKISMLMDLFGEQVILQSSLDLEVRSGKSNPEIVSKLVTQLKKITHDLQHTMVTLRMVSLDAMFYRLERSIRDVAKITSKKVKLHKNGQHSELDKTIIDALIDPLVHVARNAVDHGLESNEERKKKGKEEEGNIYLSASRTGGAFEIVVEDDGKGLDKDAILKKAIEKGIVKKGQTLTENQIFDLIYHSGFSTRSQSTEISGRGVGMDVVRSQVANLKGTCQISSVKDQGTKMIIRVPLSLAMFNGTIVKVNQQRYVVPNSDFTEALTIKKNQIWKRDPHSDSLVKQGNRVMRIIDLGKMLHCQNKNKSSPYLQDDMLAIIATFENEYYALLIHDILSQEQIVLKELGPETKAIKGASGGTILGDGKVALVLDISSVIKNSISKNNRLAA